MKTKNQLQNEAMEAQKQVDDALRCVPSVQYLQCSNDGRKAWDRLADALQAYRTALLLWRTSTD